MKVNIFTVVFRIPEFTVLGDTNDGCVFLTAKDAKVSQRAQ
jgi:hypothetical protein